MTIASGMLFSTWVFLIRDQKPEAVWLEGAEEPLE